MRFTDAGYMAFPQHLSTLVELVQVPDLQVLEVQEFDTDVVPVWRSLFGRHPSIRVVKLSRLSPAQAVVTALSSADPMNDGPLLESQRTDEESEDKTAVLPTLPMLDQMCLCNISFTHSRLGGATRACGLLSSLEDMLMHRWNHDAPLHLLKLDNCNDLDFGSLRVLEQAAGPMYTSWDSRVGRSLGPESGEDSTDASSETTESDNSDDDDSDDDGDEEFDDEGDNPAAAESD